MWKWSWKSRGKKGNFERLACLTGHSDRVGCLTASRSFSIIVSGSDDGSAIVWDLNRHRVSRSTAPFVSLLTLRVRSSFVGYRDTTIQLTSSRSSAHLFYLAVNQDLTTSLQSDKTGDIVTCSGTVLRVWTVNGVLLATCSTSKSEPITAIAFSLVRSA